MTNLGDKQTPERFTAGAANASRYALPGDTVRSVFSPFLDRHAASDPTQRRSRLQEGGGLPIGADSSLYSNNDIRSIFEALFTNWRLYLAALSSLPERRRLVDQRGRSP